MISDRQSKILVLDIGPAGGQENEVPGKLGLLSFIWDGTSMEQISKQCEPIPLELRPVGSEEPS